MPRVHPSLAFQNVEEFPPTMLRNRPVRDPLPRAMAFVQGTLLPGPTGSIGRVDCRRLLFLHLWARACRGSTCRLVLCMVSFGLPLAESCSAGPLNRGAAVRDVFRSQSDPDCQMPASAPKGPRSRIPLPRQRNSREGMWVGPGGILKSPGPSPFPLRKGGGGFGPAMLRRPHPADRARLPSVRKRARQVPPGRVAVRVRGTDRLGAPAFTPAQPAATRRAAEHGNALLVSESNRKPETEPSVSATARTRHRAFCLAVEDLSRNPTPVRQRENARLVNEARGSVWSFKNHVHVDLVWCGNIVLYCASLAFESLTDSDAYGRQLQVCPARTHARTCGEGSRSECALVCPFEQR